MLDYTALFFFFHAIEAPPDCGDLQMMSDLQDASAALLRSCKFKPVALFVASDHLVFPLLLFQLPPTFPRIIIFSRDNLVPKVGQPPSHHFGLNQIWFDLRHAYLSLCPPATHLKQTISHPVWFLHCPAFSPPYRATGNTRVQTILVSRDSSLCSSSSFMAALLRMRFLRSRFVFRLSFFFLCGISHAFCYYFTLYVLLSWTV